MSSFAAGCVPALPQGTVPEANRTVPDAYPQSHEDPVETALLDWREFFGDENLAALIDEALENNQELNIAVQENFIASYEVMSRRGDIFPRVDVGTGVGIEHVSEPSSQGVSDGEHGLPPNLQGYSFGLYASWEIDIWNRLRNLADASAAEYLAGVEGRYFMVTRLVAEIAQLYYELMALDRQLEVVRNSVALQQDALNVVRLQFRAAASTSLAVTRFEAELLDFADRQYGLQQRIVETENRLNFLVGRFPQPVARSSDRFMDMQPNQVHANVPSQLLVNRPDIRAAELRMRAAHLNVDAARARYFPALSLEAGIGYGSFDILRLVETPGSLFYSIFGNLTAPLFNRNGINAGYFSADASQRQAIIGYERAILNAYIEVVNRMSLANNMAASYVVKAQRVQRLGESIDVSMRLYAAAHADYLEVLTARRDSLDAQLELIETKQRQLTAAVSLYQALGGGWRTYAESRQRPDAVFDAEEDRQGSGGTE